MAVNSYSRRFAPDLSFRVSTPLRSSAILPLPVTSPRTAALSGNSPRLICRYFGAGGRAGEFRFQGCACMSGVIYKVCSLYVSLLPPSPCLPIRPPGGLRSSSCFLIMILLWHTYNAMDGTRISSRRSGSQAAINFWRP